MLKLEGVLFQGRELTITPPTLEQRFCHLALMEQLSQKIATRTLAPSDIERLRNAFAELAGIDPESISQMTGEDARIATGAVMFAAGVARTAQGRLRLIGIQEAMA